MDMVVTLYGIPALAAFLAAVALFASEAPAARGDVRLFLLASILWPVTVAILLAFAVWWLVRQTARVVWYALGGDPW
jgi:hypothetical protein